MTPPPTKTIKVTKLVIRVKGTQVAVLDLIIDLAFQNLLLDSREAKLFCFLNLKSNSIHCPRHVSVPQLGSVSVFRNSV